jgi:hypothetical protein
MRRYEAHDVPLTAIGQAIERSRTPDTKVSADTIVQ